MSVRQRDAGEKERFFKELEKEFDATFRELIPGIIHDFANPLNGILGRSELLGGRVEKTLGPIVKNIDKIDNDIQEGCKKIIYDIGLITKESNRLFNLFNDVAGKFRTLQDTALQGINLSELMEEELAFLQFYPDSKHRIKKELILDREIPEVPGVKAHYSISLAAIIRHSVYSMKESESGELVVTTGRDNSHVYVKIEDTGAPITAVQREAMLECGNSAKLPLHDPDGGRELFCAISLLKRYNALFQIVYESGHNIISIRIPYIAKGEA